MALGMSKEDEDAEDVCSSDFQYLPDSLLLNIFSYLNLSALLKVSQSCSSWRRVALDEFLWKDLFLRDWKINRSIPIAPGNTSWIHEYKRLYHHSPAVECQVLKEHRHQVLHVSFSHNGKMFATCSKDGTVKVWNANYPVSVRYNHDMRNLTWKYTQFSQFNSTDTLLLVSGVHFGSTSTTGEIAVFGLDDDFELQSRVINKPYDVFGTWYNDTYLLSGNLHWMGNLHSCSGLWLNKATQAIESEHESVVMQLYKFQNINASSIRTIMIANCLDDNSQQQVSTKNSDSTPKPTAFVDDIKQQCTDDDVSNREKSENNEVAEEGHGSQIKNIESVIDGGSGSDISLLKYDDSVIEYGEAYRDAEMVWSKSCNPDSSIGCISSEFTANFDSAKSESRDIDIHVPNSNEKVSSVEQTEAGSSETENSASFCIKCQKSITSRYHDDCEAFSSFWKKKTCDTSKSAFRDKYLIFSTGSLTFTPHQIGIKRVESLEAAVSVEYQQTHGGVRLLPNVADNLHGMDREDYDKIDHLIELHGHIIGMALSPDHRYLYVNSRPWPNKYIIGNPLYPPPIAQEIDVHVIDLLTMKEVGKMHKAHKAYTPNDDCFFIFLDVCDKYVASGAEDKHGYIWDRHYGICLNRFPHEDVVNSVAFNPKDSEMLVTVSDDFTVKVWYSKNRMRQFSEKQ